MTGQNFCMMPDPTLEHVDHTVDALAAAVAGSKTGHIWNVIGDISAGKSTVLLRLYDRMLAGRASWPILLAPPHKELDSGIVAFTQMASGFAAMLRERPLEDDALSAAEVTTLITGGRSWGDKFTTLSTWLQERNGRFVFLCDEPMSWRITDPTSEHFGRCTEMVERLISTFPCVVTGPLTDWAGSVQRIQLPRHTDVDGWLAEGRLAEWGPLEPSVRQLIEAYGKELRTHSPLEIRLLVALAAISQGLPRTIPRDRRALGVAVQSALADEPRWRDLGRMWAILALVRMPFSADLLTALNAKALELNAQALDATARAVLDHCLLYSQGTNLVLHDMLRKDVASRGWLSADEERTAHGVLAPFYARYFAKTPLLERVESLPLELEAYHHATLAQQPGLMETLRAFFSEQLDVLGRFLAETLHEYRQAADVFARAVAWDDTDDYAHHCYAFNLDIEATSPTLVEHHYRTALRLNPSHPWWWSRFIRFLIVRGRSEDAIHEWNCALDALSLPDRWASPMVYQELHGEVVAVALHRSLLDFTAMILAGVPDDVVPQCPWYEPCKRRLETLHLAREGRVVVPARRLREQWWLQTEHLEEALPEGYTRTRWWAGRVEYVDADRIEITTAEIDDRHPSAPGEFRSMSIDAEVFESWLEGRRRPIEGDFVEFGQFRRGPGEQYRAIVLPRRPWQETGVPKMFPDPERYLKRAQPV